MALPEHLEIETTTEQASETFPFDYCLNQMELISSVISLCTTCHYQWLIYLPTK